MNGTGWTPIRQFIFIFSFILSGCEQKPLILNTGDNGLTVNVVSMEEINAESIIDTVDVANSFKLYLGSIDTDSLGLPDSLGRQSSILFRFSSAAMKNSALCSDTTTLTSLTASIVTSSQMEELPDDPITYDINNQNLSRDAAASETAIAWFIPEIDSVIPWDESLAVSMDAEQNIFLEDILTINLDDLRQEQITLNNSAYKLNFLLDSLSIDLSDKICNEYNDFGVWLEESQPGRLTEFFSTEFYSSTIVPTINAVVDEEQTTTEQIPKYEIENVTSDFFTESEFSTQLNIDKPFYGMITSQHIPNSSAEIDLPSAFTFADTAKKIDIFTLTVDTLTIPEDSSGTITFKFHDLSFFNLTHTIGALDPAEDNWNEEDSTGTENNQLFDVGELFFDCGYDRICDEDEPGYNPDGTENNFYWDEGEYFSDCGLDSLCDEFEEGFDSVNNPDPEGDNYLPDPSLDDWNSDDSTGTENNGKYDVGESFQDIGFDWIPDSILVDTTGLESNGIWDYNDVNGNDEFDEGEDYEPWVDAGTDGLWNHQEPGYNPYGPEGNVLYDYGEFFEDCGVDSVCNINEDGYSESNPDPNGDDLNLDPSGDNWNVEDSTFTEKNNTFDWEDSNNNGVFDLTDIHEEFMDWGTDQTPDSLILIINPDSISDGNDNFVIYDTIYTAPESANYSGNYLNENLGMNAWEFNFYSQSDTNYDQPELNEFNDFTIWPSSIQYVNGTYEITISIWTKIPISGFEFIFDHTPYYKLVTEIIEKNLTISNQATSLTSEEKMIQDLSVYPSTDRFDDLELENEIIVNYGDAVYSNLRIPTIDLFLVENPGVVISDALLHLNIDTTHQNYYIHPNGLKITINRLNQEFNGNGDPDITPLQSIIVKDESKLEFSLKNEIQYYLEDEHEYHGYILSASQETFNFSTVTFYTEEDSTKAPKLEVLWVE